MKRDKRYKTSRKLFVGLFTYGSLHGGRDVELKWFNYDRAIVYPLEWHRDKRTQSFWNITPVIFPTATHDWPEIKSYGLFDTLRKFGVRGMPLVQQPLSLVKFEKSITVLEDDYLMIPSGELVFPFRSHLVSGIF